MSRRYRGWAFLTLALIVALSGVAQSADNGEAAIGPNFQISFMGGTDLAGADQAEQPAAACSSTDTSCLVVWRGEEDVLPLVDDEHEIFGAVVTPGVAVPADIRFSAQGPYGDTSFYVFDPAVAHNSIDDEYLVVWSGADNNEKDDLDIYGARYIPATGSVTPSVEISDSPSQPTAGWDGSDTDYPDVAHNSTANEYLVVYGLRDHDAGTGWYQREIFGRFVGNAGATAGSQIRISTMGPEPPDADARKYGPEMAAVAYNPTGDTYLVTWFGSTDVGSLHEWEEEIWGQLVDGTTGALNGGHIRISTVGTDGDPSQDAKFPDVAASPDSGEFLVVWGDNRNGSGQEDIWGQRVDSTTGALRGSNFEISQTLPATGAWSARIPTITYNTRDSEYLVVWQAQTSELPTLNPQAFGQRLDPYGGEMGTNDFRISRMIPDSDPAATMYEIEELDVAFSAAAGVYLPVWTGHHPPSPGAMSITREIFGQWLMPRKLENFLADR